MTESVELHYPLQRNDFSRHVLGDLNPGPSHHECFVGPRGHAPARACPGSPRHVWPRMPHGPGMSGHCAVPSGSTTLSGPHEAELVGRDGRLNPVSDGELAQDGCDVRLHRPFTDEKGVRDLDV
jgi:hypothetical protein